MRRPAHRLFTKGDCFVYAPVGGDKLVTVKIEVVIVTEAGTFLQGSNAVDMHDVALYKCPESLAVWVA